MRERTPNIAAGINAIVVAVLPLFVMLLLDLVAASSNTSSTTVHASGAPGQALAAVLVWLQMWRVVLPASAVAAWRTYVYARRRLLVGDRGWRAVVEAGVCGFLYVLLMLTSGILRPTYLIIYGGIGFLVGLGVGLVLRFSASMALKLSPVATA